MHLIQPLHMAAKGLPYAGTNAGPRQPFMELLFGYIAILHNHSPTAQARFLSPSLALLGPDGHEAEHRSKADNHTIDNEQQREHALLYPMRQR